MSEKDRFGLNEDMDFESDADVQEEYDDFEDPLDGYSDLDDMSGYEDLSGDDAPVGDAWEARDRAESEETEVVEEGLSEKIPADKKVDVALMKKERRRGISAMGLGILFTASILVAGVGAGGAIMLIAGVNPVSLWQPRNLLQIDQLMNFTDHPLNTLYMVTVGIVFLALLGSYKMAKAAIEANRRTRDAESILDRLTSLSLDKQEEWQSQEFKEFPPAEAFVIRTLGAWRLREAREKRLMGVEGELHRLEKALNTNSRSDLTGRFDHPAVGRLADEMVRYFDARDTAVGKLDELENKDRENRTEILDLLQESRQWNGSTLDHMGVQCAALDELAGQMDNLARHIENAATEAGSTEGMTDIIEGIRKDIAAHFSGGMATDQTMSELNDLVDRGSKLAFKIAMEVARLGPRGERLLPMSQSLEDLTTGFRQLTDRVNNLDVGSAQTPVLSSVHKKLETLTALITQDDNIPWRDMADEVQDFGPAAALISGKFTGMVEGFNGQEDRLILLGKSFAEMTGAEFDSNSIPRKEPSDAPVASLDIIGRKSQIRTSESTMAPAAADPFPAANLFPGADSPFLATNEGPGLEHEEENRFSLNTESPADMPLSGDEEKVYDLEDLGASPAEEPETEVAEQIFDLSSFGATPMAGDESQDSDQVFDLSDFGAMSLEQAVGSDQADASDEDAVFDLSDFGAKPMK